MSDKFMPHQHTPENLAAQLAGMPENYAVVGSLGRCILLNELKMLRRNDGTPVDIDAIDMTGGDMLTASEMSGAFRVDAGLTKIIRPVSSTKWGLFLNTHDLFCTIDAELCAPQMQPLGWADDLKVAVMPAPIQAQIIHTKAGNYKNAELNKRFVAMTAATYPSLPADVIKNFIDFKRANTYFDRMGPPDSPYSTSERIYRSLRRNYLRYSPGPVQIAVDKSIGHLVRSKRGTKLQ